MSAVKNSVLFLMMGMVTFLDSLPGAAEKPLQDLITTVDGGKPRIADQPPLLFHSDAYRSSIELDVARFFQNYRDTLSADRRLLFDKYAFVDTAYKVVGVGSVGTRCLVVLFVGRQDDHLLLQVKEARRSVLEERAGGSPFANQGERVVIGQRLMQSASDIFLGWSHEPGGRDYYAGNCGT
jgi:hypothetical protein